MNTLPSIDSIDVSGKTVFVRVSLDVPLDNGHITDTTRLEASLATIQKLKERDAKRIIVAGHMGRPNGEFDPSLSTKNVIEWYKQALQEDVYFIPFNNKESLHSYPILIKHEPHRVFLLENLRFWEGEEENSEEFVDALDSLAEVYINDCFDTSHREHASIVGLPKTMPSAFGVNFIEEYNHLSRVIDDPTRPVVAILSGVKEDKLEYLDSFYELADKVLIAGRLPEYLGEEYSHPKAVMAHLIQDKEDITLHSVEHFETELRKAKTIIVSGPMGKFEEEGHRQGTQRVFEAVAANEIAFKLAGGGNTNEAIEMLGIRDKFDWISTAGGAMLEFLANKTLPGIEATISK